MIFYTGKFPYVVRVRAEVWSRESKWREVHAVQAQNFHFRLLGKRVVYRPRVGRGGKCPFLIRLSVWH